PDAGATDRDGQHEKMNVDGSLAEAFPDFLGGEPTTCQIGEQVEKLCQPGSAQQVSAQPKTATQDGGGQLRFPFIDLRRVLQKFDIALHDLGPGNVAPTPERRRRGTSHARNGRGVTVVADGDFLSFLW